MGVTMRIVKGDHEQTTGTKAGRALYMEKGREKRRRMHGEEKSMVKVDIRVLQNFRKRIP